MEVAVFRPDVLSRWRMEYNNGKERWIYELDDHDLYVQSERHGLYSFSVTDKDGKVIRSEYDFENEQSAKEWAESEWEDCLKPIPRLSGKGQFFNWRTVERGSASECRIGMGNSVLLQTRRDEETGLWSYYAYYKTVLIVEEEGEEGDQCKTDDDARNAVEAWYQENALDLLHIHALYAK